MKKYMWLGTGIFLVIGITFIILSSSLSKELHALELNRENILVELEKAEQRKVSAVQELEVFDKEEYKEEIDIKTVNAREIGEEIIEIQNQLAEYFRINGNLPSDFVQERLKRGPELAERQAQIADIDPTFYYDTWKLNMDWELKLESIISYENVSSFPVIFSMMTTENEPAGFVKAIYNVEEHRLENVERHYTAMGLAEEIAGVGN